MYLRPVGAAGAHGRCGSEAASRAVRSVWPPADECVPRAATRPAARM